MVQIILALALGIGGGVGKYSSTAHRRHRAAVEGISHFVLYRDNGPSSLLRVRSKIVRIVPTRRKFPSFSKVENTMKLVRFNGEEKKNLL